MNQIPKKNLFWRKMTVFLVALGFFVLIFALLPSGPAGEGGTGLGGGDGSGQGTGAGSGDGAGSGTGTGDGEGGTGDGAEGADNSDSSAGTEAANADAQGEGEEKTSEKTDDEALVAAENHDSATNQDPGLEEVKPEDVEKIADKKTGSSDEDAGFEKVKDLPDEKVWNPSAFKLADKKKTPQTKKTVRKAQSRKTRSASSAGKISKEYATRSKRGSGEFARKMGATQESEDAVDKGLAWLAKVQNKDGHWNTNGTSNPYPDSLFMNATPAGITNIKKRITLKNKEIAKLKKAFVKEKNILRKKFEAKKKVVEEKRKAKKADLMKQTAAQANEEKKKFEAAVKKITDTAKAEINELKQDFNQQIQEVNNEVVQLKKELAKSKENMAKAKNFFKGTGGVIPGRKQLSANGHDVGATGLAVLAFLGAGYTHKNLKSPYAGNVQKALNWLVSRESDKGRFLGGNFYDQGIATMAVCEAYGMTKDSKLKDPAQKALDCIASKIGSNGGYGYGGPGDDTHLTSFQVMGLKSGILAGLHVPKDVTAKVLKYYKAALNKDGTTGYNSSGGGQPGGTRTAVGLFSRMFLKVKKNDPQAKQIAGVLDRVGPQVGNQFQTYDGTYAMFQMGEPYWKRWNDRFRDPVIKMQNPNGSWRGRNGAVIGTTFYVMSLEVYYRYLPVNR